MAAPTPNRRPPSCPPRHALLTVSLAACCSRTDRRRQEERLWLRRPGCPVRRAGVVRDGLAALRLPVPAGELAAPADHAVTATRALHAMRVPPALWPVTAHRSGGWMPSPPPEEPQCRPLQSPWACLSGTVPVLQDGMGGPTCEKYYEAFCPNQCNGGRPPSAAHAASLQSRVPCRAASDCPAASLPLAAARNLAIYHRTCCTGAWVGTVAKVCLAVRLTCRQAAAWAAPLLSLPRPPPLHPPFPLRGGQGTASACSASASVTRAGLARTARSARPTRPGRQVGLGRCVVVGLRAVWQGRGFLLL
jgi:hypothetical protein